MDKPSWFVQSEGKVHGPLASDVLRRMLADSNVSESTLVIRDGWNGWQTFADLRRFLNGAPVTQVSVPAPPVPATAQNQLDWFVSVNGKQLGPLNEAQMQNIITGAADRSRTYVIHRSWKDWKPLNEVFPQSSSAAERKSGQLLAAVSLASNSGERRVSPTRVAVVGQVYLHNDQALVATEAWNISESGIFLRCIEKPFAIGEAVKLTFKCPGMGQPFHLTGKIARYQTGESGAGFAVQFVEVAQSTRGLIARYVSERAPRSLNVAS